MVNQIFVNEKSLRSLSEFEFLHDPNDKTSKLGVGSFACVKLAKDKKTGKQHAIKIINMEPSKLTKSDLHNIKTEITIHRKLDHPNVIKFHDYIQKDNNVYLILDYAENGNLYSYLHKRRQNLSLDEVFNFFYQTCLAIQYLHQNDVLHRDIKPENLLLDKNHNIRLCDFGWAARKIKEKRLTFCGTYEYMAPEIVHNKPYDYRVDIWSLGILLYELIHREAPFKGRSLPEISKSLGKSHISFSTSINPDAKDLIKKILKLDPSERPSMAQILSHPWVQSHLTIQDIKDFDYEDLQIEEYSVSPRDIRHGRVRNLYGESPRFRPRKENENFKSEVIIISNSGVFAEPLDSKLRKNSHNNLFSSFHAQNFSKENEAENRKDKVREERERTREKRNDESKDRARERDRTREKEKIILVREESVNKSITQRGSQMQSSALTGLNKTNEENILSSREYVRSSPSVSKKMPRKIEVETKNVPGSLYRKKKIFENLIASPTFQSGIDGIMNQISSYSTSHNNTEKMSSMFSAKNMRSAQTPSGEAHRVYKFFSDNFDPNTPSGNVMRSRTGVTEDEKRSSFMNKIETTSRKNVTTPKEDHFASMHSPTAHEKTASRRKNMHMVIDPEILNQDDNLALPHKHQVRGGSKPPSTRSYRNVLGSSDQNKYFGSDAARNDSNSQKEAGYKRGQVKKPSGETSRSNLHISSLKNMSHVSKENRKEFIRDKENQMMFVGRLAGKREH